jgi:hypothetical protein
VRNDRSGRRVGWMGKLVLLLGTIGLVVDFVLAALFLVPGPVVKIKRR